MGGSRTLVTEYLKVRSGPVWIDRTLWILVGVALFEAFGSLQWSVGLSAAGLFNRSEFLALILWTAPLALGLLTLRSMVRGTGWTPRTLHALTRAPLKLSAAFFGLGLGTVGLRALVLSWFAPGLSEMYLVPVKDAVVWLVLSLMILAIAQARRRRASA
jgi:hypothetical protein